MVSQQARCRDLVRSLLSWLIGAKTQEEQQRITRVVEWIPRAKQYRIQLDFRAQCVHLFAGSEHERVVWLNSLSELSTKSRLFSEAFTAVTDMVKALGPREQNYLDAVQCNALDFLDLTLRRTLSNNGSIRLEIYSLETGFQFGITECKNQNSVALSNHQAFEFIPPGLIHLTLEEQSRTWADEGSDKIPLFLHHYYAGQGQRHTVLWSEDAINTRLFQETQWRYHARGCPPMVAFTVLGGGRHPNRPGLALQVNGEWVVLIYDHQDELRPYHCIVLPMDLSAIVGYPTPTRVGEETLSFLMDSRLHYQMT